MFFLVSYGGLCAIAYTFCSTWVNETDRVEQTLRCLREKQLGSVKVDLHGLYGICSCRGLGNWDFQFWRILQIQLTVFVFIMMLVCCILFRLLNGSTLLLSDGHRDATVMKRLRSSHNTVDYGENSTVQKWWQPGSLAFSFMRGWPKGGTERLNIHTDNGQAIDDNRILTHISSNQPREPNQNVCSNCPRILRAWSMSVFLIFVPIPDLFLSQDKPEKAGFVPQTN